jgi:hypothetical protein
MKAGWKPIDEAPRDGTPLLLAPNMVVGVWDYGAENWLVMSVPLKTDMSIAGEFEKGSPWFEVMANAFGAPTPTHWMPLPPVPTP